MSSRAPWLPRPLPGVPDGTVLYDGVCVLCSGMFHFVVRRDHAVRFRFTAVQSTYGRWLAGRLGIDAAAPETFAVVQHGTALFRSDAGLALLRGLPRWRLAAALLSAVPRRLRDAAYDWVARRRYRLFGRRDACLMPGPALARHLLPEDTPHA